MPDHQRLQGYLSFDTAPIPAACPEGTMSAALTRRELRVRAAARARRRRWRRVRTLAVAAACVALVAGVTALLIPPGIRAAATRAKVVAVVPVGPHPARPSVSPSVPTCPLTGLPAPGGKVPARPALGVKIGNYPDDRPSAGLDHADIVFEEPVEGAITRLVAVFQCQAPALVGDLRSARQPDAGILSQLSDPLFVHAGGIAPVIALMQSSPLIDENVLTGSDQTAVITEPGRVAPYAMFADPASLWALDPSDISPPAPIFPYSLSLPAGSAPGSGTSVHIPYSDASDITWTWNPSGGDYLRSYAGLPDKLVDGSQTTATNVVIMTVRTSTGSWVENSEGAHEVLVPTIGSGPLVVMRDGAAIAGTWRRASLTSPNVFTAANGAPITLRPGNTWEELVPAGVAVTVSPG